MKVAYLVNEYPKASHSFIRREIAGVEACGIEVERYSIRRADDPLVDEADRAEAQRTHVLLDEGALAALFATIGRSLARPGRFLRAMRIALRLGFRSDRGVLRHLAYLAEACLLLRHLERFGAVHLHAHFGTNPAAVALLVHELGGPPFSFTGHGFETFSSPASIGISEKLARAHFAVAVCEHGRAELSRWCRTGDVAHIEVIRCGVDRAFFDEREQAVPAAPRLVCVARFSPEKGHRVLFDAAALLAAEGIEFEIVLVGDGALRPGFERFVRGESGASGNPGPTAVPRDFARHFSFAGWKSNAQVRAEILASRALIVPSLIEGLPVVIMEALALRRPVIASDVGGISELVERGATGWLVPPGSPAALAEALRSALGAHPDALLAMGREGARRVAQRHDSGVEARRLAELFRRRNA